MADWLSLCNTFLTVSSDSTEQGRQIIFYKYDGYKQKVSKLDET